MIHATEKSIKDLGEDKVSDEEKQAINKAIEELKETLKADDKGAIEAKTAALAELSGKLAEKLYADKGGAEAAAAAAAASAGSAETADAGGDDVVDAEFEEVKDDKK
jgi:molecular chaperone DnaK